MAPILNTYRLLLADTVTYNTLSLTSYNRQSTAGMNTALLSMSIVDFIIFWTFPKLWRTIFLLSNELLN